MTTPDPGPTSPYAPGPSSTGGYPPAGYPAPPAGAPAYPAYPTPPVVPAAPGQVPPPGWATPGGYVPPWAPPPVHRTEPLAVASLATSCAAPLVGGLAAPVGLVLGIAALRRIRRSGDAGRGYAITGVTVGAALCLLMVLLVAAVVVPLALAATTTATGASNSAGAAGPATGPGTDQDAWADEMTMPWFELTDAFVPGDCFATAPETYDMSDATVVDCALAHATEVVDRLAMSTPVLEDLSQPDAEYTDLLDRCEAAVGGVVDPAVLPEESYADVYYPHPSQWDAGGRTAYCVLTTYPSGTGSALAGTFGAGAGTSA